MPETSERLLACLPYVLSYWGAANEDAPIALERFTCCQQFICQCPTTDDNAKRAS